MGTLKSIIAGFVAIAATLVSVTAGPVSASADTGGHPDFTAQARSLGLSKAQVDGLRARADSYVAKLHGTQVAINKVRFDGGTVLLTLPGDKRARDLDAPRTEISSLAAYCQSGYVCIWSHENFTGDRLSYTRCNTDFAILWSTRGSWINAQTGQPEVQFKDNLRITRWWSPIPVSSDAHADWSWVWYIEIC